MSTASTGPVLPCNKLLLRRSYRNRLLGFLAVPGDRGQRGQQGEDPRDRVVAREQEGEDARDQRRRHEWPPRLLRHRQHLVEKPVAHRRRRRLVSLAEDECSALE